MHHIIRSSKSLPSRRRLHEILHIKIRRTKLFKHECLINASNKLSNKQIQQKLREKQQHQLHGRRSQQTPPDVVQTLDPQAGP